MTVPTVSVVMRVFNCEKYVGQAIESILAQTFQDFEIVIVDDASTDGTEAVLQAYTQRDERIRVFRNETNQGPVRSMNIGLSQARGEFVAVLDGDDVSLPHRLETQVGFLKADPHLALVGGGSYTIDEDGEEIRSPTGEHRERKGPEEVRQYLERGETFAHSSLMFRRECIEAIGFYDESFASAEDYDMLIRMAEQFDVFYYEEALVQWRWLHSGITGGQKRLQAAFAELARRRSEAKREGTPFDLQQEYERLMATGTVSSGRQLDRPITGATYYYDIGLMLLEREKPQQARKRFLQALQHRGNIRTFVKALGMYVLSFFPNVITSRLRRLWRKVI